jgi:hypothetical protein
VEWNIAGDGKKLKTQRIIDSMVEFDGQLNSFKSTGPKGSIDPNFVNSVLTVDILKSAKLGRVNSDNAGIDFGVGIADQLIKKVIFVTETGRKTVKPSNFPFMENDFAVDTDIA